jgi:hypothetical protein
MSVGRTPRRDPKTVRGRRQEIDPLAVPEAMLIDCMELSCRKNRYRIPQGVPSDPSSAQGSVLCSTWNIPRRVATVTEDSTLLV